MRSASSVACVDICEHHQRKRSHHLWHPPPTSAASAAHARPAATALLRSGTTATEAMMPGDAARGRAASSRGLPAAAAAAAAARPATRRRHAERSAAARAARGATRRGKIPELYTWHPGRETPVSPYMEVIPGARRAPRRAIRASPPIGPGVSPCESWHRPDLPLLPWLRLRARSVDVARPGAGAEGSRRKRRGVGWRCCGSPGRRRTQGRGRGRGRRSRAPPSAQPPPPLCLGRG
eukprot:scaffold2889_cov407-Prasinococcus_capsulatus_cf.AAC.11